MKIENLVGEELCNSINEIRESSENYEELLNTLSKREREKRKGPYPYYGATSIMDYIDDYLFDGIYILLAEDGSVIDAKAKLPITGATPQPKGEGVWMQGRR